MSLGKPPKLSISWNLAALGLSKDSIFATPDHPFNFTMRKDGADDVYMFEQELQELATLNGSADILAAIKDRANIRNRILYASDEGVPSIEFPDETLLRHRNRIYRLCLLTIGVLQTKSHQLFVRQNLQAFLAVLRIAAEHKIIPDEVLPKFGRLFEIKQQDHGVYSLRDSYRGQIKIRAYFAPIMRGTVLPSFPIPEE